MQYPYLYNSEMDKSANQLLFEYEQKFGEIFKPPIPIEKIAEMHLNLGINLVEEVDDILGYLNPDKRTIFINEKLYPDNPDINAGRYNFTVAHELGHWVMHVPVINAYKQNGSLLDEESVILCRKTLGREMIEIQADYFAASLLIPAHLLKGYWKLKTDNARPLFANRVADGILTKQRNNKMTSREDALCVFAKDLADIFNVSAKAMAIRLKQVGLLIEEDWNYSFCL